MVKDSIKQLIIRKAESHGSWFFGGQMEDFIRQEVGAKASNASRRMRELVEVGILEHEYAQIEGKGPRVVRYRIVRKTPQISQILPHKPLEQARLL